MNRLRRWKVSTPTPSSDLQLAGGGGGFGQKDIGPGDVMTLETLQGKEVYRVERVWIVSTDDVSVLDRTPNRSLTLVTCYPFYFVGSAPERYIVRAVRVDETEFRAALDRGR